jgi:hypothetical protein
MFSPLPLPPGGGGNSLANGAPPPHHLHPPSPFVSNSPDVTPHYPLSLFDFPTLQSFNPNFYLTENHHTSYLQYLLRYFHLKKQDHFILFLKALERLENPLSLPLVIEEAVAPESMESTGSPHVTVSIDHQKYQETLQEVGLIAKSGGRDVFENVFQIGDLLIRSSFQLLVCDLTFPSRSYQALAETRLRGQMLFSFPTEPSLRQTAEAEEEKESKEEKEEVTQEEYADYICCICLDIMKDPVSLPCGPVFPSPP